MYFDFINWKNFVLSDSTLNGQFRVKPLFIPPVSTAPQQGINCQHPQGNGKHTCKFFTRIMAYNKQQTEHSEPA
jgi:hypothetical protein